MPVSERDKPLAKAVALVIRQHVAAAVAKLEETINALQGRIKALEKHAATPPPRGEKGADGQDGKDGAPGEKGADGQDGKDGAPGEKGADGQDGKDGKDGAPGQSVSVDDLAPTIALAVDGPFNRGQLDFERRAMDYLQTLRPVDGQDGAPGEKGADGINGRDSDPDEVAARIIETLDLQGTRTDIRAMCREIIASEVQRLPPPPAGKDGQDGKDGASVTTDQIKDVVSAHQAEWALDFEQRAQTVLQAAIDRMPAPHNGHDGLDLQHFDAELDEDGRTLRLVLDDGQRKIEKALRFDVVLDRGVFAEKTAYLRGDGVTWGGSFWIAQQDQPSGKPGSYNKHWRLAVKRGQAGKSK